MNKKILFAVVAMLGTAVLSCGCSKEAELEPFFNYDEAISYLTDDERAALEVVCSKEFANDDEVVDAIDALRDIHAKIAGEEDSAVNQRRSAAVTWRIAELAYNRFNGTCAIQVMFAARTGLIEAQMMMENPPRGLTTFLLPPGDPRRIEDE